MKAYDKEIKDFCKKYQYQLKRFDTRILYAVLKKLKGVELEPIKMLDIDSILEELSSKIADIKKTPTEPYKSEEKPEIYVTHPPIYFIIKSIKLIKHTIPGALRPMRFYDRDMEIAVKRKVNAQVTMSNYRKIIDLKKAMVLYMFTYIKDVYKMIPGLLKNGGEKK